MIIVSQDKETIVNFDNIVTLYVIRDCISEEKGLDGYNIDYSTNDEINIVIATYKTEERAKEVLQEIIQTKSNFEYYKYADESKRNEVDPYMKTKYKSFDTYEMPSE